MNVSDLENLKISKYYLEKLAQGINPFDGSVIPDNEVVNHVRLSRCFFMVSNLLQTIIDQGGLLESKPNKKKKEFSFTIAEREAFQFSDTPIPVMEITRRLNNISPDNNCNKLPYTAIRGWLLSLNLLEVVEHEGKKYTSPTEMGKTMGINCESREGANGPYFVVTYSQKAQHFIVDNLEGILEYKAGVFKAAHENHGKSWSEEEEHILLDMFKKNLPTKQIAAELKRTSGAVRSRLKMLGVI